MDPLLLPEITVTPVSTTGRGEWIPDPDRSLQIRAGVRPLAAEILDWHRMEPENRPPLPGPVLVSREDADRVAELGCTFVRLEGEELGALSGHVFLVRGFQMDPTWAVWDLVVRLEVPELGPVHATRNLRA